MKELLKQLYEVYELQPKQYTNYKVECTINEDNCEPHKCRTCEHNKLIYFTDYDYYFNLEQFSNILLDIYGDIAFRKSLLSKDSPYYSENKYYCATKFEWESYDLCSDYFNTKEKALIHLLVVCSTDYDYKEQIKQRLQELVIRYNNT